MQTQMQADNADNLRKAVFIDIKYTRNVLYFNQNGGNA